MGTRPRDALSPEGGEDDEMYVQRIFTKAQSKLDGPTRKVVAGGSQAMGVDGFSHTRLVGGGGVESITVDLRED